MERAGGSGPIPARPALVYFAKAPRPGLVKTRLCPPLTASEAAGLYRGFLQDLLRPLDPGVCAAAGIPVPRSFVFGWPTDGLDELGALAHPELEVRPQEGATLWERMTRCFERLFADGYDAVVLRNTDSPDLDDGFVAGAVSACRAGRVVLGPDPGGGYVLVGLTSVPSGLFAPGLDASGPDGVLARTRARIADLGLGCHELPERPDVDDFDDLLALWRSRGGA